MNPPGLIAYEIASRLRMSLKLRIHEGDPSNVDKGGAVALGSSASGMQQEGADRCTTQTHPTEMSGGSGALTSTLKVNLELSPWRMRVSPTPCAFWGPIITAPSPLQRLDSCVWLPICAGQASLSHTEAAEMRFRVRHDASRRPKTDHPLPGNPWSADGKCPHQSELTIVVI